MDWTDRLLLPWRILWVPTLIVGIALVLLATLMSQGLSEARRAWRGF